MSSTIIQHNTLCLTTIVSCNSFLIQWTATLWGSQSRAQAFEQSFCVMTQMLSSEILSTGKLIAFHILSICWKFQEKIWIHSWWNSRHWNTKNLKNNPQIYILEEGQNDSTFLKEICFHSFVRLQQKWWRTFPTRNFARDISVNNFLRSDGIRFSLHVIKKNSHMRFLKMAKIQQSSNMKHEWLQLKDLQTGRYEHLQIYKYTSR